MTKKARLLSPLMFKASGKKTKKFLILVFVVFVLFLSWASFREFQVVVRQGDRRSSLPSSARNNLEGLVRNEADTGDDEDEGDYYGGELDVKNEEDVREPPLMPVVDDPPPAGDTRGEERQEKEENPEDASDTSSTEFTVKEHTEFWGDALVWGTENLVETAEECLKACKTFKPKTRNDPGCNVWVFCGDKNLCTSSGAYKQCWLKHLAHPEGERPASEGPSVGWTSGIALGAKKNEEERKQEKHGGVGTDRTYHVVISAQVRFLVPTQLSKGCNSSPPPPRPLVQVVLTRSLTRSLTRLMAHTGRCNALAKPHSLLLVPKGQETVYGDGQGGWHGVRHGRLHETAP